MYSTEFLQQSALCAHHLHSKVFKANKKLNSHGALRYCKKLRVPRAEGNTGDGGGEPSLISKPALSRAPARVKPREAPQQARTDRPKGERNGREIDSDNGPRRQQYHSRDCQNGRLNHCSHTIFNIFSHTLSCCPP